MKRIKGVLSLLIRKTVSLYTHIKHRDVDRALRYFYFATYYGKVYQLKFFFRDYVFKKKYKEVRFGGEFAPELMYVLPYAYWHYKNGTLNKTVSSKFTKEFYFFSPEHEESYSGREPKENHNFDSCRVIYSHDYDMDKWEQVPLKETYRNDIYIYDKPILIIANRYNSEWDGPPVSYFGLEELAFMFDKLKDQYQIIYNRPRPQNIVEDNSNIYELNDYEFISENYSDDVILMENLFKENAGNARNFNHLQLMVYANAERFISIHGGTATLASFFGGINLIYSKKGPEHYFGCFHKLFPKLSGATILHAKTIEELKDYIEQNYVDPHMLYRKKEDDEDKNKGSLLA